MAKPKAQPEQQDYTGDEHWGKGGRFVIDPITGKRVPAEKYQPEAIDKPDEELNNADQSA